MKSLAKKYENLFGANALDIENIAIQKNQDYENETTWWIFEDGSALGLDSDGYIFVKNKYGLNKDYEQLV